MTLRIFPIFLDKNGKICPSMQCQTNFSSFLKIEKFCPSVGQRRFDAEFWISFSAFLVSGYDGSQRVGLLFSKFFKILLKNFAPVYHGTLPA
jgi:hypothetical protein